MVFAMSLANKIIIAIAGDPVEEIAQRRGDYGALIGECIGPAWQGDYFPIDIRREVIPDGAAGIVISGSSANLPNREPWMLRAQQQLARVVRAGTPVFGICFGHQLLAQALGGEVTRHPSGREISTVPVVRVRDDALLGEQLPERFSANACHSDTVARLPEGAQVLAGNEHEPHQVLRFSERCYGVQFHPEFDAEVMRAFVHARAAAMQDEGLDPREALSRVSDTPDARDLLRRFIRSSIQP